MLKLDPGCDTVHFWIYLPVVVLITASLSCTIHIEDELGGGPPPLGIMIDNGATVDDIKKEIKKRPSVIGDTGKGGQTNLFYAVAERKPKIVKLLLDSGEDPNVFSYESPLFRAVSGDDIKIVELLLKYGADPFIKAFTQNVVG